jgi:hypothetical protein
MGVVNTTYTFSGTDTITSAKLNNIIDDTTFTSDAIQGTTLQVVSPGKLAVSASGITSNELASNSVVTAKIADSNVTTAKIADANITQAKLGANVVGNGPAFRAVIAAQQTYAAGAGDFKVTLVEDFDTNNNFLNSRFTATIAGYYLFTGSTGVNVESGTTFLTSHSAIYKNGTRLAIGAFSAFSSGALFISPVSSIFYMVPGDYVELYVYQNSNINGSILINNNTYTYLTGCLIRSA